MTICQRPVNQFSPPMCVTCILSYPSERSAQYILAWKRGIAVLTAGSLKVTVNPRIRLMPMVQGQPGYNLEIRDVHIGDAGDYICQIGTMEVKEIVHTLEVLVPAKIDYIAPVHPVEVHKGARVRLECRGTGNPMPRIIWSRRVSGVGYVFVDMGGNML